MKIDAKCPECGYKVDDATGIGDAAGERPEEDTIALCIRCAGVGVYTLNPDGQTLGIRLCTPEEKVELSEDETLQKAREVIQKADFHRWFAQ
jgi:hypothetical protein